MNDVMLALVVIFFSIFMLVWFSSRYVIIGWKNYQDKFTTQASSKLDSMFLFLDSQKVFIVNVVLIVVAPVAVYFLSGSPIYAVLVLVGALAAPKIVMARLEKRRLQTIVLALPDALQQIAGSMRSGSTFTSAIEIMVSETKGPISQEFSLLLKEQKMGISQDDALQNLAERVNNEDMDLMVTAALIAKDVGGNLAESLERLSSMLRQKIEMEMKIDALTAQGKLQGYVVGLLPFAIMFFLAQLEPEAMDPLFSSVLGWIFMATIIFLELVGALMIKKIVTVDI